MQRDGSSASGRDAKARPRIEKRCMRVKSVRIVRYFVCVIKLFLEWIMKIVESRHKNNTD